ncbi:HalOD1 output domain-containing protein [Halosimplex halobium]|uniref:HalOD1 output domain-containing protein n=1 Tax=Halosimplex halobium TaxID=3396618 RepID=UPI003F55AE6E
MAGFEDAGVSVHRHYDSTATRPSIAVLAALADIKNERLETVSASLGTTLHDHVDADALDRLIRKNPASTVSFRFEQYRIRIDDSELVVALA